MKRRRDFDSAKQIVISIIFVQLFWCPIWGLDPDKTVDQYLVDQWQTQDVISSDTIVSISQTPDGYLWLATTRGLIRYDGIKFSIIPFVKKEKIDSPETTTLLTLFLDESKTLRIGSFGSGLTSYHYKTGQFQTFTTADGLTENNIRCINEDMKGNLWIGFFTSYAGRISNGKFTAFNDSHGLAGKKISAIVEDRQGNLLFGSRENGVFRHKEGKFFKHPVPSLENCQIITMYEDSGGTLWIGTDEGLFKVTDQQTVKYTKADGLSHHYISDIVEDSKQNLWVGTTKGLNRIKRNQDGTIDVESLMQTFSILCLFEDKEKSLWVGTDGSGLIRLKDGRFMSYAPLEVRRETVISVFEDRYGDTWIGTFSGKLFRCRSGKVIESIDSSEISGTGITAIAEDARGNLWLGTIGKGIFQQEKGTFIPFTGSDRLSDKTVTSIYRDSRGHMWFSTLDGVNVFRHPVGVFESFTSSDGLSGKRVNNVYEDKNQNIWIAADKGITVLKNGKIAKQDRGYYLKDIQVTCIYEDPSNPDRQSSVYWIATYGHGLKRLTLKDGKVISLTSYTTNDGMTTNFIFQFFEDQEGNFWLMSNSGVLLISKTELNRFAKKDLDRINCISFGISDGLKSLEFNNELSRHSALKTRNHEFWFITKKGIAVVDPKNVRKNKVKPTIVIEEAVFDRDSIALPQESETYIIKGNKKRPFDKKKKYNDTPLNPQYAEVCIKRLKHLVENEKIYLDENISLQSLAGRLNIQRHQLSQLFNEKLNQSFSDFINYHRIKEAKKILTSPKGAKKKNTAVAYDVGFSTMTAFYKAFRKFTGMTPNKYKKEIDKGK